MFGDKLCEVQLTVIESNESVCQRKVYFSVMVFIFSDVYREMDRMLNRTDHEPPKKRAPTPEPASRGLALLTIATVA
jgi:hypothetical protein